MAQVPVSGLQQKGMGIRVKLEQQSGSRLRYGQEKVGLIMK